MTISTVLAVSSGTLASLTGVSNISQLDIIFDWWVEWELDNPTDSDRWQDAWNAFKAGGDFALALDRAAKYVRIES